MSLASTFRSPTWKSRKPPSRRWRATSRPTLVGQQTGRCFRRKAPRCVDARRDRIRSPKWRWRAGRCRPGGRHSGHRGRGPGLGAACRPPGRRESPCASGTGLGAQAVTGAQRSIPRIRNEMTAFSRSLGEDPLDPESLSGCARAVQGLPAEGVPRGAVDVADHFAPADPRPSSRSAHSLRLLSSMSAATRSRSGSASGRPRAA